jgi:predicted DNA-binding transcriptional regulator AlpA
MTTEAKDGNGGEVLDLPAVARMIGTPESTLRYWRHLGVGPKSFKIGRRVKYLRSDVAAFIERSRATDGRSR